ncbi:hypothetical protein HMPREF3040_01967, partial [Escherichia coli]
KPPAMPEDIYFLSFVLVYWYSAIHNNAVALFFTGEKPSWQH